MHSLSMAEQNQKLAPSEIQIYLFGPPRVESHHQLLAIPRRQARALLYRLAAGNRPLSRDGLSFLFWPDVGQATAGHNLSRLITILHNALPDSSLLIARDDQLGLHPQRTWSDTRTLDQLWTKWARDGDASCLHQAVELHCGPFLDGFCLPDSPEFDTWASQERERWTRLDLQVLSVLIETLAIDADYRGAIGYAQRYLIRDELAEDVHRRLIELYALEGNRSAALRQYERCVMVLERELGVSPTPETQAVYRAVLYGVATTATPAAGPHWRQLPAVETPLLGRASSMHALEDIFLKAKLGHGKMVLISGEPGIGKSRLMREFAMRVRGRALVLAGSGFPETRMCPYQPVVEALRPHLAMRRFEFDPFPPWLAELAQLFSELRPLPPGLPPVGEPDWARARLFEALETLLLRLAEGASATVLCLDDLHWADSATLDWLAYLGRRLPSRPLLVVGAYRDEDANRLAELRNSLAKQGALCEMRLEGLDRQSMLEMLQHLGGRLSKNANLIDRLSNATGGNPFFLLETLRSLTEAEASLDPAPGWLNIPLPDSVRQAIEMRVQRLSPTARQVLEAAAVLGLPFAFDALHLTAGRQEMEIVDGLDELVARQMLVERAGCYHFRHDLVRDAVVSGLSYYRRRLLHRRAAEALERLHSDDATALARHFERAGMPGQAARYAVQAGLAAKKVYAPVEARMNFDHALALLEQEAAGLSKPEAIAANRRLRVQALGERGWALRLLGDMAAYACDLEQEARLAELLGDSHTLAHLRWRQASAHLWFCRHDEARAAAEDGLRLSQAAGDSLLEAACLRAIGLAARAMGDYELAKITLEQALQLFGALDRPSLQVHTLGNLSTLACYRCDPQHALGLARQAMAICEAASLQPDRRLPLGDIGAAAVALGDVELARQTLAESLTIARQMSDRTQEILCLGHLGWLDVQERQATLAVEHLQAALALAEQINSLGEQPWLHAGLAEALQLAGDQNAAAAHAQQAVALADATGQAHDQSLVRRVLDRVMAD